MCITYKNAYGHLLPDTLRKNKVLIENKKDLWIIFPKINGFFWCHDFTLTEGERRVGNAGEKGRPTFHWLNKCTSAGEKKSGTSPNVDIIIVLQI